MEKKITNELKLFLLNNNFRFSFEEVEHPGCWGRHCEGEHFITELKIWKKEKKNISWSFDRCTDKHIINLLNNI